MPDDLPDLDGLSTGDTVRVEYVSRRSGNPVEREGGVTQIRYDSEGDRIVSIHDERHGFFRNTYVVLAHFEGDDGDTLLGAISVTTAPQAGVDPPADISRGYMVAHSIDRRQYLGVVKKVIRVTPTAIGPNEVL